MTKFFQEPPVLRNTYIGDPLMDHLLLRMLPADVYREIKPDLLAMGERAAGELTALADQAERELPRLEQYDPWGRRRDHIVTSEAWRKLDRISAEEGLVAIGYERHHGPFSRLYQFAKLYLFHPSSAIYTCPLAMTDGAARVIEVMGSEALREGAFCHLTSRDPSNFWTSGQWMTERVGGSDVGNSETLALPNLNGFRLHGHKWFTSATTSQMALTLARIQDSTGSHKAGSKGLSLFYLETRREDGSLNHIEVHRLKDKLGTRALPTAELTLKGTPAVLLGEPGHGVRNMAYLLNITRIYNAISSVSYFRRGLTLAQDYARRRVAFGRTLDQHPLHIETLADLEVEQSAGFHLTFHLAGLLGRVECGMATSGEAAILRLLTPLVKLFTAKQAIAGISEILECFGGAGYVEDTGIPRLLRNAQVLSIWEGTTNVLSMDVLRAIQKEDALPVLVADIRQTLGQIHHKDLLGSVVRVEAALEQVQLYSNLWADEGLEFIQGGARGFSFALAKTFAAALLLSHAQWMLDVGRGNRDRVIAQRWCARDFVPILRATAQHRADSNLMVG